MKWSYALIIVTIINIHSFGQLATWSFTGSSFSASSIGANISTASDFSVSNATFTSFVTCTGDAPNYDHWNGSSTGFAEVSIQALSGCTMSITGIFADLRRSGTGPATVEFRSSDDGFVSNLFSVAPGTASTCNTFGGSLSSPIEVSSGSVFTVRFYATGATGTTGTLRFDNVEISGTVSCPMPVSLLSFDASSSSNQVYLTWATATEVNNEGFQVERSGDGSSWNAVSFVGGAGNSNSIRQYEYLDHPGRSGLYYYRLKQIDIDGQFTLSPIRQVRMIGEEALSVRNTLVYDLLTVDISRGQPGFTLGLYSITGQLLQSIKVEPGAQSISIPLDRLAAGSYLVRTIGLPELKVWKIIKY